MAFDLPLSILLISADDMRAWYASAVCVHPRFKRSLLIRTISASCRRVQLFGLAGKNTLKRPFWGV
jgi:hypothetical protein